MPQIYAPFRGGVLYAKGSKISKRTSTGIISDLAHLPGTSQITQLSLNSENSLLAVVSDNQKVDVFILGPQLSSARKLSNYYDGLGTFDSLIISLKWHPCSRGNSTLLILTQSRLYSYSLAPGEPKHREVIELKDSSNLVLDPAGICFGSDDSPLGNVTLYLSTVDGDIYRVYPFTCTEMELTATAAARISDYIEFDSTEFSTVEVAWNDLKHSKTKIYKRVAEPQQQQVFQKCEPLRLTPYPKELYEEDILDVSTLSIGWSTDILIQTSEKHVNFYALVSPTSDTLVLVSSVKFAKPQSRRRISTVSPEWVFIECDNATHVLDISGWNSLLEDSLYSEDNQESTSNSTPIPQAKTEVQAFPPLLVYHDTHGGFAAFDRPETWTFHTATNAASGSAGTQQDESLADMSLNLADANEGFAKVTREVNSRISLTLSKIAEAPSSAPDAPLVWGSNLGSLQALNTYSETITLSLAKLSKLLTLLQIQRQRQQREANDQRSDAVSLESRGKYLSTNLSDLTNKAEKIKERQGKLSNRLNAVTKQITQLEEKKFTIPPSQAEEGWFKELKSHIPNKIKLLTHQVDQLKQSLAAAKHSESSASAKSSESTPTIPTSQFIELHWRLKHQEDEINSLKEKLRV